MTGKIWTPVNMSCMRPSFYRDKHTTYIIQLLRIILTSINKLITFYKTTNSINQLQNTIKINNSNNNNDDDDDDVHLFTQCLKLLL